jgi:hypothetical protein
MIIINIMKKRKREEEVDLRKLEELRGEMRMKEEEIGRLAGAELFQAQTQICMSAEAELILTIEFQISA